MASQTITLLEDDLTGGEAKETVRFALDGRPYEIDLNAENAARLRETLGEWTEYARKAGSAQRPAPARPQAAKPSSTASSAGVETTDVRQWAEENGLEVAPRGRIARRVLDAFRAATGG